MRKPAFSYHVDVEEATGRILAAFFRFREGRSAEAREFANGSVFAHYNNRGDLIGIEILGPCKIALVNQITNKVPDIKKFVRDTLPPALVA